MATNCFVFPLPKDFSSFVELLRWRALHQPDLCGYTFLLESETKELALTYQELDQQARVIGAWLQGERATGERVLLLYPPGLEYISAFFGCLYAGAVAVPVYPPDPARLNRTLPRLINLITDAHTTLVLTTTPILNIVKTLFDDLAPSLSALRWLATDSLPSDLGEAWYEPDTDKDSLAFLQYTSGSTGTPKGVMLTHGNLLHNSSLIYRCFNHTPESRGVIWLPPYHDMGLIGGILQPLYGGFPVTLMSPLDFLRHPLRWLQAISRYRATTSGGPNFAYDLCVRKTNPEEREQLDLSSWKVAFNGAEPIESETLQRFATAFAVSGFMLAAFYPCYGLAEATLLVSGGQMRDAPVVKSFDKKALQDRRVVNVSPSDAAAQSLVGCGQTLSDQSIVIVDPETLTNQVPGRIGEIWVSGPSIAQGYWNRSQETADTFRAYVADTGEGPFLRTGDLGFRYSGELFIAGRIKDILIIRGRNYYPHDIEQTVEQRHPALRPGCGAAFSVDIAGEERLVVVQEIGRQATGQDLDEIIRAIRRAITEEHELQAYGVLLIEQGSIPKTSSGKIQRHACRAAFLDDSFTIVAKSILDEQTLLTEPPATQTQANFIHRELSAIQEPNARQALLTRHLQEQTARILRQPVSQLDVQHPLSTLGLDSLTSVELTHEIETSMGVVVSVADVLQDSSISQLASLLLAAIESPSATQLTIPAKVQPIEGKYPVSHGQRAIWFLHQLAPESATYNIASAARIRGNLDSSALQRAFQRLIERHPSLRTTFPALNGEPVQYIHSQIEQHFHVEDAALWDEETLKEHLEKEVHQPFDLEQGPLLRVYLFNRSLTEHILLLVVYHIIADFWSLAILVDELGVLYQAEQTNTLASLPSLPLDYVDYTRWQLDMLAEPEGERLWTYWQKQLAGTLPVLDLPTDRPLAAVQTYHGTSQRFKLNVELTRALKALSRSTGATLYTILLAAFQLLLSRYTRQDEILIGFPTAGRNRACLAGIVGYFANPVALRGDFSGNPSFLTFLQRVRQTVLEILNHSDYPFDLLVERLQPTRDTGRPPIFQVMFIFQQSPLPEMNGLASFALGEAGACLDIGELNVESIALERRTTQFDLTLVAAEMPDGIGFSLQYNTDLFERATIARIAEHMRRLLAGIVANPAQRLSEMPLLSEAERRQLLEEWGRGPVEVVPEMCLHNLFEAQAQYTPDRVAIVFEHERLTYQELDRRANQVANYLHLQHSVGSGVRVGLCVDRSLTMLVGLLGILKAGGTYIPLDPTLPVERLTFMLEDSQAAVLLTDSIYDLRLTIDDLEEAQTSIVNRKSKIVNLLAKDDLEEAQTSIVNRKSKIVNLHADWQAIARQPTHNPASSSTPDDLAYVIYTSGSTGKPKGVQISHRAVVNLLNSMRRRPGFTEADTLMAVTTLAFDIAALELFLPLFVGSCVVLVSHNVAADGVRLAQELANSGATVMQATPSTWGLLMESGWQGNKHLRALCGGEAFPRPLANWLVGKVASVWNMYGPTETTIWSMLAKVEEGESPVPLGRPIANTQIYLVDRYLLFVSAGVAGEVYIGGNGVAWGYFQRPELTAEKFLPNPFSERAGSRLYRTGDVARYRADGTLEFLGRVDHQVKIHGFRIELGEIEAALTQHPFVQACVVLAREDKPGQKRLVAYVVPAQAVRTRYIVSVQGSNDLALAADLRTFLKAQLPDYMVPWAFVLIEALPLTPNKKVDRRALPAPDGKWQGSEAAFTPPRTLVEEKIADIWTQVLSTERISVHDNFFELGGHSLLATRVMARIRESFGVDVPLHRFFEAPSVAGLAEAITQNQNVGVDQELDELDKILKEIEELSEEQVENALDRKVHRRRRRLSK